MLAARHQVGDFLAGLFALAEIGNDGAADQHGKVVAYPTLSGSQVP